MERMVAIGYIVKPRGVKGELIVRNDSRWYEPFELISEVEAELDGRKFGLRIEGIKLLGDKLAVKFEGIENPEDAAKYRGAELRIKETELPVLEEDEFYAFELDGFEVIDYKDESAGTVVNVINSPANDIIVVEDKNEKEHLLPAIRTLIDRIDFKAKKIFLKEYEGLFE
ncbi:MAG: 16S rRNA processing protein RimM [candidate division Zixibacteria bacterium]|nr:16S rRNA processing protein RimM [candidate division Zixibacteria bacterium]